MIIAAMPTRLLLSMLAIVLAVGAAPAAATADGAPATELVVRRDQVLVGDFGGFGGQMNQHVYANISGPPPTLHAMEEKVVALRPQLVRIFFHTSEWTNADRMESFVRTVQLAERANAEINVTWQGSTFEFAMRNMPRFADELAALVQRHGIERLWVTMFNEPNTTARTLSEYEQVYRSLHRLLVERGVRDRIRFMGGDLTRSEQGPSQAEWLKYMASHMGDLLDAWSVHVYWDFWDTEKIDQRLMSEVRTIVSTIPPEQHRPLYVTEFGVRGLETFEGETSFNPGSWPDGTGMSETEMSAFQHAWFNLRAAQLGYSGTVKWDLYPAKYDTGTQDFSALGRAADGWPERPVYNLLELLGITTEPRGGHTVEVTTDAAGARGKLVTAYVSPANDVTVLGLHKAGGSISATSHDPVTYGLGGLPANASFRLLVWNGNGTGTNVDYGFFSTDANGAIEISVPKDAVFTLTTTPIMTLPW
jgi:hypothetical protein